MTERITLSGGGYTAVIDPANGANCISLRHAGMGAHILRECEGEKDNPYLYGMPILFPANRIAGGVFEAEGRTYRFPINEPKTGCHLHGTLHETPVTVLTRSACSVRCRISSPYPDFPHAFSVDIAYTLSEAGLLQEVTVHNASEGAMPLMLGFHTTFALPFLTKGRAEDVTVLADVGEEIERNMETYLPTGRILSEDGVTRAFLAGDFSPTEHAISRHYRAKDAGRIVLTDGVLGVRLVYENSDNYPFRLFYNGGARDFLCLEPMTAMANAPNAPFPRGETGFFLLPAGCDAHYTSKIYLEAIV